MKPGQRADSGWKRFLTILALTIILVSGMIGAINLFQSGRPVVPPFGNSGLGVDITTPTVDTKQKASCSSVSTCHTAAISPTYPGETAYVFVSKNGTETFTVQDSAGNTLLFVTSATGLGNLNVSIWADYNYLGTASEFFVNASASSVYSDQVAFIEGVSATSAQIDVKGSGNTGHGTAMTASITPTTSNDLTLMATAAGISGAVTAGTGSTLIESSAVTAAISGGSLYNTPVGHKLYTTNATSASSAAWVALDISLLFGTTPSAPSSLAVSSVTTTSITWTWTAAHGAVANQTAQYFTTSGGSCVFSSNTNVAAGTNTFTKSGLTTNVEYGLEVRDWNSTGEGTATSCVEGVTASVPGAPSGLTDGTNTTTTAPMSWTLPTCSGGCSLTNVTIYWETGAVCTGTLTPHGTGSGASTSYTITGLTSNTLYSVAVTVWNATGQSAKSSCVHAITATVPAAPTALSVSAVTTTTVALTWTNHGVGNVNNTVYYASGGVCTGTLTAISLGVVATSKTVTGLTTNVEYSFAVTTWNNTGQSAKSSCVTQVTASVPPPATGLTYSLLTTTTVTISWALPTCPGGCSLVNVTVYQSIGSGCVFTGSGTSLGASATTVNWQSLPPAHAECWGIEVFNATGGSSTVTEVLTTLPNAPTSLSVTAVTTTTESISFTKPIGTLTNETIRGGAACGTWTVFFSTGGNTSSGTVTGLGSATSYCWSVQAWSAGGAGAISSNEANGTTLPLEATSISVTAVTVATASLSWTNPSGTLVNDTIRAGTVCGTWTVKGSTSGAATSGTIAGLAGATAYCFSIQAWSVGGGGLISTNEANGTTLPGLVVSISVTSVTISTIALSWTNPSGTLANDTIRGGTSCGSWTVFVSAGTGTTGTATGLAGATSYCFALQAWSAGGAGVISVNEANGTTLPGKPTSLSVSGDTTTTISLGWTNPSGTLANDTIRGGTVCGAWTIFVSTGGAATSGTVTGLTMGTSYCFSVQAWSAGGAGAISTNEANGTTSTGSPPGPPTGIAVTGATTTSLSLTWTAPSGGGILNYTVYIGLNASSVVFTILDSVGSAATTYTASGLHSAWEYAIAVRAWNATGGSILSNQVVRATLPGAPTGVTLTMINAFNVTVSWTNPAPTANLTTTNVHYELGSACSSSIRINLLSVQTTYTIYSLAPGTLYCFFVTAQTDGGAGAHSSTITGTTAIPLAPATPLSLTSTGASYSSVALKWSNPIPGSFTNITLYYSTSCHLTKSISMGNVTTSYTVEGLLSSTTYGFTIQAWNYTTPSGLSACVLVETAATGTSPPPGNGTAHNATTVASALQPTRSQWDLIGALAIIVGIVLVVVPKRGKHATATTLMSVGAIAIAFGIGFLI